MSYLQHFSSLQGVEALYLKYSEELKYLSSRMQVLYHEMQKKDYGTSFGDVEGEIVFMTIRELKPEICFEVSPNAGWSTNYSLAALEANNKGVLHSFEILETIQGRRIDQVITGNLIESRLRNRLMLHVGDVMEVEESIPGPINFLLIDSRHDEVFARWYVNTLLPRLNGVALIQDIAFIDQLEKSSEADFVWNWLKDERISFQLVGKLESELSKVRERIGIAERRPYRCNSIFFEWPKRISPDAWQALPALDLTERFELETQDCSIDQFVPRVNQMISQLAHGESNRVNKHREFLRLGKLLSFKGVSSEAKRAFNLAIGCAMQCEFSQRKKALIELFYFFVLSQRWLLAFRIFWIILSEPKILIALLNRIVSSVFKGSR